MNLHPVDWFYVQHGSQIGPVPVARFDDLVRSGRITLQTLVWREGLANWQPFGSITADPSSLPSPPAPPSLTGTPPIVPGVQIGCAECGVAFPESEMIPFAGSWICAKCKPLFLQRVREGAPLAAGGEDAWQSGDTVVTRNGGTLPGRCIKCNSAATGRPIKITYYWHSDWLFVLLLMPPIYMIVFFIVSKRLRFSVPVCDVHRRQRRVFLGLSWLFSGIGIGAVIAGVSIDSAGVSIDSVVLCSLAVVFTSAAMVPAFWKGTRVSAKSFDGQYVWLGGCCKEYRAALPKFPDLR